MAEQKKHGMFSDLPRYYHQRPHLRKRTTRNRIEHLRSKTIKQKNSKST